MAAITITMILEPSYCFSSNHVGYESWTIKKAERWKIDAFEHGVGEDSWEFLGLQEDPPSPS